MEKPICVVTGASRGIGAATAELLASQGWFVVLNYAANHQAALAVQQRIEAAGGACSIFKADVGEEADVLALFAHIDSLDGQLKGLVNNAGVVDVAASVSQLTVARLERMWRVNLTGPFLCAREAVLRMSAKGGSIVNLSSAAARLGSPGQYVDYAASKAGIDTFTLGLAREVAALGIRVNAVRPGIIDTDIHASGGQPNRVAQLAPQVPMQRGGTALEVANAVAWLLSDAASYTTGAILDVTGGR